MISNLISDLRSAQLINPCKKHKWGNAQQTLTQMAIILLNKYLFHCKHHADKQTSAESQESKNELVKNRT